jgi:uncharacterized membrane protein YqjE
MFETIKKARQVGAIALERVGEYLELFRISAEIQGQNFVRRVIGYAMAAVFVMLSFIFLGMAVIITCWDTPYRIFSAWGVAGLYALIALVVYIGTPSQADSVSAFDTVRDELQQDIKLMKDIV